MQKSTKSRTTGNISDDDSQGSNDALIGDNDEEKGWNIQ